MNEIPINSIPQKQTASEPVKLPNGSAPLPTKEYQEILDKVFDVMKNPKHYNITVHTEDNNKKLKFVTGLKMMEGVFMTNTAEMTMRVSGIDISLHVGGILPDNWAIKGVKTYVANGYDISYSFADWLWKNKKEY